MSKISSKKVVQAIVKEARKAQSIFENYNQTQVVGPPELKPGTNIS